MDIAELPALTLLGPTGGYLKRAMGDAVDAAIAAGVLDLDELTHAAIVKITTLRSRNGVVTQHPTG